MKRRRTGVLFAVLALIGVGILAYPTVADQWNTYRQQKLITSYSETVSDADDDTIEQAWAAAKAYNRSIGQSNVYSDAFADEGSSLEDSEYWQVLNLAGDGVMGWISIPKIDVEIPIYHGTSSEVMETGAGHMSGSQLPVGGVGNHAVLAAHRGLPSAKLFTDIDQLEEGDMFYLYILDETLAYEVDQILPMVDKDDMVTLSEALATVEGEDYVTLFTCTPYGVNTHRLLVRGHRVPFTGDEEDDSLLPETVRHYYAIYLMVGLAAAFVFILVIRTRMRKLTEKRS